MFDSNGNYIEDFIPNGSGGLITPNAVVIRETNVSSVSGDDNHLVTKVLCLEQNYPNPFNPSTVISYQLPATSKVTLKVYNILGKEVVTLINEELSAGLHQVEFDARGLSSGVYFYQLKAVDPSTSSGQVFIQTNKMIYMK